MESVTQLSFLSITARDALWFSPPRYFLCHTAVDSLMVETVKTHDHDHRSQNEANYTAQETD